MFQKYEASPSGLIFGGALALILSIFGLRTFNHYLFTASEIVANEIAVVVIGYIIGFFFCVVGLVILGFGIHYTLLARREYISRS